MAEERVVLTAVLEDEASAPLGNLSAKVEGASKKIAKTSGSQADAVAAAGKKISGSAGTVGKDMDAMATAAAKAGGKTGKAVEDAAGRISRGSGTIGAAARRAGEAGGDALSSGFTSKLKNLAGAAAAMMGAKELLGLASGAVNTFSELEDSSAAAGTIYGKNMAGIVAASKGAGEALGMTEQQYIGAAQTFGIAGQAAGLGGKDLAKFSSDLTSRAGDMASFFGKKPEEAIEAIGAAMRGETEPIRAFGVMLDDATMREKAMKMGLVATTKDALEPQQKALVAQALILEKTNGQAGDFKKTMNSTANVSKRLEAAQTNLSAKIGAKLAPAFTAVRMRALGAVNGASKFVDGITAAQAVAAKGGTTSAIAKALGLGPKTTGLVQEAIGSVFAFKAAVADPAGGVTSNGVAGVFERIGVIVGTAKLGVSGFFAALREGDVTSDGFVGFMERIGDTLHKIGPAGLLPAAGGIALLLASFGKFTPILGPITGLFAKLGPMVGGLGGALKFLLGPIGLLSALFIYAYSTSEPFRTAINGLVGTLLNLAMNLATSLMPIFQTLVTTLLPVIAGLFTSLAPLLLNIVTAVAPLVVQLVGGLAPILVSLISSVLPIVIGLITMLAPLFMSLVTAVVPLIPPLVEIAGVLLRLAMSVITPLMPLITTIAGLLAKVLGGAIDKLMPIITFLLDKFIELVDFLKGPLEGAISGITDLFNGFGDIVGDVVGAVGNFFGIKSSGGAVAAQGNSGGSVQLAGGGVLGGYAPGKDTIPAMLSKGESVLVPELTRAIGPSNIMALNKLYSGGRPAGAGPAPASLSGRAPTPPSDGTTVVIEKIEIVIDGGDPAAVYGEVKRALADIQAEAKRRTYA
ncbi:tape measure protein [Arthrobacter phage Bolt007]|uniref:Tape measure protein n=1 Tax=Arthrobacter phage Bolt007 TaxID=3017297 RepID=A0AA49I8E8_9CAUD|nr:tape measure protein [Arthrobacter phage Bolt007]